MPRTADVGSLSAWLLSASAFGLVLTLMTTAATTTVTTTSLPTSGVTESSTGSVTGSSTGSVTGSSTGSVTGSSTGSVTGSSTGSTTTSASAAARKFLASQLSRAVGAVGGRTLENATYSAQMDPDRGWMCIAMCNRSPFGVPPIQTQCMCIGCEPNNQCVYSSPECAKRCRCQCNPLSESVPPPDPPTSTSTTTTDP